MTGYRLRSIALRYGAPFALGVALLGAWQAVVTGHPFSQ